MNQISFPKVNSEIILNNLYEVIEVLHTLWSWNFSLPHYCNYA